MSSILKYIALMLLMFIIITAGVLIYTHNKDTGVSGTKANRSKSIDKPSDQYNVSFSFAGSRSQLIDLIKGDAQMNLVYTGTSKFTVNLYHKDGTLLANLADRDGPFSEKQMIEIPETGAYLLDVKTTGEWSLNKD